MKFAFLFVLKMNGHEAGKCAGIDEVKASKIRNILKVSWLLGWEQTAGNSATFNDFWTEPIGIVNMSRSITFS